MLKYQISTRTLWINGVAQPVTPYVPYSGHGKGLNNPAMCGVAGVGPIPVGLWRLTAWVNHPHLGKLVTHLLPIKVPQFDVSKTDIDRSAFFIHGDNQARNFTGSDGCLILDHDIRAAIQKSGETQLEVVA